MDDDQDALAAEYVLGTLSAEERANVEALISFDPGFEAVVHQWERRLGELNVMVEAVEPPRETWGSIKTQISAADLDREEAAAPHEPETLPPAAPLAIDLPSALEPAPGGPAAEAAAWTPARPSPPAPTATPTAPPPPVPTVTPTAPPPLPSAAAAAEPRKVERSADVIYLAARVRRWRGMALGLGALAAVLALYVAIWQAAPHLMPPHLQPPGARMEATAQPPVPHDQLVAALQPGPVGPAFLLTLDPDRRTWTVRRVSARPEPGKSYELWIISSRLGAPRSLGLVESGEFTQRALPANYNADTLRSASYAVSLEPAGGSKSGAPTGPVLFTGQAVQSLPPPPPPKT